MSTLSIGQMNQLGNVLEEAGFTSAEITQLMQLKNLSVIRDVLTNVTKNGVADMKVIDLNADASVKKGSGWKVDYHKKGGQIIWDPKKFKFFVTPTQEKCPFVEGDKFLEEMNGQSVFNVNLLYFFLENPRLVPTSWQQFDVFFWDTRYIDEFGFMRVPYMYYETSPICYGWNIRTAILNSGYVYDKKHVALVAVN
jgi:hypothetical protein